MLELLILFEMVNNVKSVKSKPSACKEVRCYWWIQEETGPFDISFKTKDLDGKALEELTEDDWIQYVYEYLENENKYNTKDNGKTEDLDGKALEELTEYDWMRYVNEYFENEINIANGNGKVSSEKG
ncbi:unnamed protein product [Cylicocyclus nassatus]|uniref:Uncharacterized protein n=1 Tax=Cylicocyclus nassatus TaxID=53992 RepID=A0AA36MCR7_CYLNA|nr:unnamed protein product [Cylicocyclus nassatus]